MPAWLEHHSPLASFAPYAEEGGEVDQRRLRLYERSKLRYYYAIITCDAAGEGLRWEAGRFAGLR